MKDYKGLIDTLSMVDMPLNDAALAIDVQQQAFKTAKPNSSHRWEGYTVLKAARIGIMLGRHLESERVRSDSRVPALEAVIANQNERLIRLRNAKNEFFAALNSL